MYNCRLVYKGLLAMFVGVHVLIGCAVGVFVWVFHGSECLFLGIFIVG